MRHLTWVIIGAALLAAGGCAGKQKKENDPGATTPTASKRISFTGSRIPREINKERNRAPGASPVQVMDSSETDRIGVISGPSR